jgi:DNA replication initiation complex subunit (GINS family)
LPTIDNLKQILDSEEASEALTEIPHETYVKLASYAQKLRAITGSSDDLPRRLAKKQLWLIEIMAGRLLGIRMSKAAKCAPTQQFVSSKELLPEERFIDDLQERVGKKEKRFVAAVVDGQPSFFTTIKRKETQRMVTVRMSKRVGEVIGADLKRYGPFEVNDVARLPAGNARVMVASSQASVVSGDDYE